MLDYQAYLQAARRSYVDQDPAIAGVLARSMAADIGNPALFDLVQDRLPSLFSAELYRRRPDLLEGGVEAGEFVLAIEDDGRGLAAAAGEGLGMLGMRERAERLGLSPLHLLHGEDEVRCLSAPPRPGTPAIRA